MKAALLVFIGGGIGSVCRFLIGKFLNPQLPHFPYGTFTVNLLGSFLIGLLMGQLLRTDSPASASIQLLLITGFCGGFTTFSAFSYEQLEILRSGAFLTFFLYLFSSISLGLLAALAGIWLAK